MRGLKAAATWGCAVLFSVFGGAANAAQIQSFDSGWYTNSGFTAGVIVGEVLADVRGLDASVDREQSRVGGDRREHPAQLAGRGDNTGPPAQRDASAAASRQTWAPPGTRHPAGLAIDVGLVHKRDGRWLSVARSFHGHLGDKTCGDGAQARS